MESMFGNLYEPPAGAPHPDSPGKKIQEMHQMLTGDLSHHEAIAGEEHAKKIVPGSKPISAVEGLIRRTAESQKREEKTHQKLMEESAGKKPSTGQQAPRRRRVALSPGGVRTTLRFGGKKRRTAKKHHTKKHHTKKHRTKKHHTKKHHTKKHHIKKHHIKKHHTKKNKRK